MTHTLFMKCIYYFVKIWVYLEDFTFYEKKILFLFEVEHNASYYDFYDTQKKKNLWNNWESIRVSTFVSFIY